MSEEIPTLPEGCGYTGKHFGAHYEDAQCFGGILYDLDVCDSDGNLLEPMGQIPCPKCRHSEWLETFQDSIINEGYVAASQGKAKVNPYKAPDRKLSYEEDRAQVVAWWDQGWEELYTEKKGQP